MFPFLEQRKFILIVGDDGAVLSYINKDKVEKRLFATSSAPSDRREINALLSKYPSIPLYMLLDTMEQSYTKQTLPAVSSLAIGKLVRKRLDRDFAASDIKGAVPFGRDEVGRRDWIYMFASAPVTEVISGWIDYITSLENKFTGIYMLPVEMENFVKKVSKNYFKKRKVSNWQFIITRNKTGGFRQVILQNGKVIFTRLIRAGKDVLPDIIAGNIEQEVLNTIDYLRRLSFSDEDKIDIIAVVSEDIKKSLETTKIRGEDLILFTPFEVANLMGLSGTANKNDKFTDLVIATNFAISKPVLKLESLKMKAINNRLAIYTISTAIMMLVVPIFAIYSGFMIFSIASLNSKVKQAENTKASIEKKWRDARKSDEYDIDAANKITDFVTLHRELAVTSSPFDLLRDVSVAQIKHASTRSFTWNYDNTPAPSKKKKNKKKTKERGVIRAIFNLEFANSGDNLEELFKNFDEFTGSIRENLPDYSVTISELPSKVTFDDKKRLIPVQVTISSVKGKKKR